MRTVVRTNVTLPKELIKAIDRRTENRSRFLAEAAARELAQEEAWEIIRKSAGILKGKMPDGVTFVNRLRKAELKRFRELYPRGIR